MQSTSIWHDDAGIHLRPRVILDPSASSGPRPPLYSDPEYAAYREGRLDQQNAQRAPQTRQKGKDMKTFWQVLLAVLVAAAVLFGAYKLLAAEGWLGSGEAVICTPKSPVEGNPLQGDQLPVYQKCW